VIAAGTVNNLMRSCRKKKVYRMWGRLDGNSGDRVLLSDYRTVRDVICVLRVVVWNGPSPGVYSIPLRCFEWARSHQGTDPAYTTWLTAGVAWFAVQGLMFISSVSLHRQVIERQYPLQLPRPLERGRCLGHRPLVCQSRTTPRGVGARGLVAVH